MEKNIKKIYMRKGSKGILKCIMTFILAVAMMTGAVPEMNLTAHASSYYTTYLVTSEDTDQTLPDKVVHFNNYDWYIIADNSTALDAGTITLFVKDNIGNSEFNPQHYGNSYNGSKIKGYLDNLISTTFLDMSDAIVSVDLQDVNVTGVKLWLLSTSETEGLNINIRKCSSNWWLRTPVSSKVMGIDGGNGGFFDAQYLPDVDMLLGVRPALKLDLSKAEFNSATKTFSAIGQTVSVTNVNLEPSTPQTIAVGDTVSFTASITPNEATDKTVKWKIGGTDAGALKLYTDAACETPLGTDATEVMTVYAKGISTGNAIVTCLSNSDSAKFASCEVTVNTLQTQIEEVLTTITATGIGQASYSTNNVANVLVNNSSFNDACGWNGTDMSIEVTAADGYTITRCVFYDDANHIATDSVSPFKAETHHLDTIPYVNSGPIYEGSRGIKKIDVIGYYTGNSVTITPGSNMTKTMDSGDALQNGLTGAMTAVVYTANDGYYFPTDYNAEDINGISVTRDSYTQITVSGTPTADAAITLAEPTAKVKPDAPTTATAVGCTTIGNNDGKITGITTDMEYKKSGAESWTGGTGSDITGLVPGTYYVRVKATDTTLASDNQELTIKGFISYTATFKVVNGKWNEGKGDAATADKTVTLTGHDGDTLKLTADQIPAVGSKPNDTYKAGSWDVTPSTEIAITGATTYTYTYSQKNSISQTVTFKVANGKWDDGTTADKTVTLTGYEGDTLKLAASQIPTVGTKPNDTYKAGSWDVTPSAEIAITGATTYTYTYSQKNSISQTVTFKVANGKWDDGTTAEKTVTLTGYEGDTLKLAANQIPTVGTKPNDTYKAGSWDVMPNTDTAITEATTYTYTYVAKEASVVTKAPEAKTLTYNGSEQELVTAGTAEGGEMRYAVTTENTAPTDENLYTTSISTGTNAGTYYVWYIVKGDEDHNDLQAVCVETSIAKAPGAQAVPAHMYFEAPSDDYTSFNLAISCHSDEYHLNLVEDQEYVLVNKGAEPDWSKAQELDEQHGAILYTGLGAATEYDIWSRTKETANTLPGEPALFRYTTGIFGLGLNEEALVGNTLTVITDPERIEGFTWQWFYADEDEDGIIVRGEAITNATSSSYTVKEADLGKYLWYEMYKGGNRLESGNTDPVKIGINPTVTLEGWAYGDTPNTPVVTGNTGNGEVSFEYVLKDSEDPSTETVPTLPGTYTVFANIEGSGDYAYGFAQADFVITKGTPAVSEPVARDLTYTESAQALVASGTAKGGTIYYVLGENAEDAPATGWATTIPTAADIGTYYVWYKVVGDANYNDLDAVCITVVIPNKVTNVVIEETKDNEGKVVETAVTDVECENLSDFTEEQEETIVEVELSVKPVSEDKVEADIAEKIENVISIAFSDVDEKNVTTEYLELEVTKKVTTDGNTVDTEIHDVERILEIVLSYDLTGKYNPVIIREHEGTATVFTKLSARPAAEHYTDGTFYVDTANNKIYLYSRYFSTYSVAYSTVASWQVTFDEQTGKVTRSVVGDGAKVTKPADPSRSGYTFAGWYKEASCTNAWDFSVDTVAADTVVYAKWNETPSTPYVPYVPSTPATVIYTIIFDANGGTGSMSSKQYSGATKLPANTFTRSGYTFAGWSTKADGTGVSYEDKDDISPSADITLYAQWKAVEPVATPTPEPTPEPVPVTVDTVTNEEKYKGKIDINSAFKVYQSGKKVVAEWGEVEDADLYEVYATYCGGTYSLIKTVTDGSLTCSFKKLDGVKIDFSKNFKVYVAAYRTIDGEKKLIAKTIKAHVVGSENKKRTNASSIELEKSKYSVKVGNTFEIKATTILVDSKKKQLSNAHAAEFRYLSTDTSIAKVNKDGTVTGVSKGTCYIWVYSRNGLGVKVKVTVK